MFFNDNVDFNLRLYGVYRIYWYVSCFLSMILDYLSFPTSKKPSRLDNKCSDTGNNYSNEGK